MGLWTKIKDVLTPDIKLRDGFAKRNDDGTWDVKSSMLNTTPDRMEEVVSVRVDLLLEYKRRNSEGEYETERETFARFERQTSISFGAGETVPLELRSISPQQYNEFGGLSNYSAQNDGGWVDVELSVCDSRGHWYSRRFNRVYRRNGTGGLLGGIIDSLL